MCSRRIILFLLSAVVAAFATSCSEGIKALYEGDGGFSFASSVLNYEVSSDEEGVMKIPVYRSSLDVNQVELSIVDTSGKFTLTTKRVVFPDKSYTSYAQVRYSDISIFGIMGKFQFTVRLNGNITPSAKDSVVVMASRKLTMKKYADCIFFDSCIFDNSYETEIYKAEEGEIYRVMDPYSKGFVAEEYVENGWVSNAPQYVQFIVEDDGHIYFEPYYTGMKVNATYEAWAYYPGEYVWGKDFSQFNSRNRRLSDTVFQLYPVYCLPSFQHGYLNEGAYPLTITIKK